MSGPYSTERDFFKQEVEVLNVFHTYTGKEMAQIELGGIGISLLGLLRFQDSKDLKDIVRHHSQGSVRYLIEVAQEGAFDHFSETSEEEGEVDKEAIPADYFDAFGLYAISPLGIKKIGAGLGIHHTLVKYRVDVVSKKLWEDSSDNIKQKYKKNPLSETQKSKEILSSIAEEFKAGKSFEEVVETIDLPKRRLTPLRAKLREEEDWAALSRTYPESKPMPDDLMVNRIEKEEGPELAKTFARVNPSFFTRNERGEDPSLIRINSLSPKINYKTYDLVVEVLVEHGIPAAIAEQSITSRENPVRYPFLAIKHKEKAIAALKEDPRTSYLFK